MVHVLSPEEVQPLQVLSSGYEDWRARGFSSMEVNIMLEVKCSIRRFTLICALHPTRPPRWIGNSNGQSFRQLLWLYRNSSELNSPPSGPKNIY
jgi:hypothetical protein